MPDTSDGTQNGKCTDERYTICMNCGFYLFYNSKREKWQDRGHNFTFLYVPQTSRHKEVAIQTHLFIPEAAVWGGEKSSIMPVQQFILSTVFRNIFINKRI